jgi:hypothetical protein
MLDVAEELQELGQLAERRHAAAPGQRGGAPRRARRPRPRMSSATGVLQRVGGDRGVGRLHLVALDRGQAVAQELQELGLRVEA